MGNAGGGERRSRPDRLPGPPMDGQPRTRAMGPRHRRPRTRNAQPFPLPGARPEPDFLCRSRCHRAGGNQPCRLVPQILFLFRYDQQRSSTGATNRPTRKARNPLRRIRSCLTFHYLAGSQPAPEPHIITLTEPIPASPKPRDNRHSRVLPPSDPTSRCNERRGAALLGLGVGVLSHGKG